MSWFNIGRESLNLWHSHGALESIVSGEFMADYIFSNQLAPHPLYQDMKQALANDVASYAKVYFKPECRKIATKILKVHVTRDTLTTVWRGLSAQIKQIPRESLFLAIKSKLGLAQSSGANHTIQTNPPPSVTQLKKLRDYIANHYERQDAEELKSLLKAWRIQDFLHLSVRLSLRPICEKAVLDAIGSLSKIGTGMSVDFTAKKAVAITCLPAIFWLFSSAASWTHYLFEHQIDNSPLCTSGAYAISYLPSTTTVLTLSTLYHAAEIGYVCHKTLDATAHVPQDKQRVRELAMQLAKKRLAKTIADNPVAKKLDLTLSPETVDKITTDLIDEAIDHYWNTLSQTKILGLPLVS